MRHTVLSIILFSACLFGTDSAVVGQSHVPRPHRVSQTGGLCYVSQENNRLHQQPIAVTFEVRGDVCIDNDPDKKLTVKQALESVTITLQPGASVLLAYTLTGAMERLSASQSVSTSIAADGATPADGLKITRIPGRISAGSLAFLPDYTIVGAGQTRNEIDPPGPTVNPIHESVILTDQPVLSWDPQDGAKQYNVEVMKGKRGTRKVFKGTASEHRRQLDKKLKPGTYTWTVTYPLTELEDQEVAPVAGGKGAIKTFIVADESLAEDARELLKLTEANPDDVGLLRFCAERLKRLKMYSESIGLNEKILSLDANDVAALVALNELFRRAGRVQEADRVRATAEKLGYDFGKKQ